MKILPHCHGLLWGLFISLYEQYSPAHAYHHPPRGGSFFRIRTKDTGAVPATRPAQALPRPDPYARRSVPLDPQGIYRREDSRDTSDSDWCTRFRQQMRRSARTQSSRYVFEIVLNAYLLLYQRMVSVSKAREIPRRTAKKCGS